MDYKATIFMTAGGLGLFLFGMGMLADGLKKVAGPKMKKILGSMTGNPVSACMVGAGVTAVIQSSSATTVMVIGFVNAALLTLKQAICVIIGTNIGTTATAWMVSLSAFKITQYALPAIMIGFLMTAICKNNRRKSIGQIILGFGILFVGIGFMEDAFSGLRKSEHVFEVFTTLANRPILAVLAGMIVTMLLQSSSASIAIVQTLAATGAFGTDYSMALAVSIPFVLGCNIGTTITAQLAAIGTNVNARRAAWSHTIFNIGGTILFYPLVITNIFPDAVVYIYHQPLSDGNIRAVIAIAHTFFNVGCSVIFLSIAGVLERIVTRLVPAKAADYEAAPVVLEEHLLNTPTIALEQAKREIIRMAFACKDAVAMAIQGLVDKDRSKLSYVMKREDYIDDFQHEITSYLVRLSKRQLSDEVSSELPVFLHSVNDLERIGDHAVNIVEIATRKIDQNMAFSQEAQNETEVIRTQAMQMFDRVIEALQTGSSNPATLALENEAELNRMQTVCRRGHVCRMTDGVCTPEAGLIFIDLVDNVEKIGDHLSNIAQSVIGGLQWEVSSSED